MPSNKYSSKEKVLEKLRKDLNLSKEKAEQVAELVMEEARSDEGNPEKLIESIKNGAKSIMADLGVEMVSYVENPSQDSFFTMMKDNQDRIQKQVSIMKEPEDDWDVVYGPVMRPNDIDKDGDVAPATHIEKAAHNFMAEGRVNQFDQDHDLNTGKGTMVESWILKEDKEYELPNGKTEKVEKGAWMIGTKPSKEVKQRIKDGEITGWSIFGQADQIELSQTAKVKNTSTSKEENDTMSNSQDTQKNESGESIEELQKQVSEMQEMMKEYMESPEPTTVKSVEELENTLKSDENNLVELSEGFQLEKEETVKEEQYEDLAGLMDYLEETLNESNFSMIVDAVRGSEDEEEMVEEEMDEDEDEEEKTAKTKGSDGEGARQSQNKVKKGENTSKGMSFQKVANNYNQEA